jgi:peptidoglycan/LPS O-acetylase OafA/YrhL
MHLETRVLDPMLGAGAAKRYQSFSHLSRLIAYSVGANRDHGQGLTQPMQNVQQPLQTIPSLNGLRAISVLLVVLSHSGFGTIVPGGLGVTIFFFLSGYLITALMLTESERLGNIAILSFYARRIFRLAPALLITLIIAYSLTYFGLLPGQITLEGLTAQLLYFANYFTIFLILATIK